MALGMGAAILGGSVVSGLLGNEAADDQADAARSASRRSVAEQRRQFNLIRGDTEPYRQVGQNALYEMSNMLGLGGQQYHERQNQLSDLRSQLGETDKHLTTGGNLQTQYKWDLDSGSGFHPAGGNEWSTNKPRDNVSSADVISRQVFTGEETNLNPEYTRIEDEIANLQSEIEQGGGEGGMGGGGGFDVSQIPGYEFRMDQGINALNNSLAASGNRFSGRAMKAAQRYGQGLASQEYGQHFNRLAGLAGTGQSAVGTSGQAGMQTASGVGNALMRGGLAAGQAQAQGAASMNNAIQGGIGNYLAYNQNRQLLSALGG